MSKSDRTVMNGSRALWRVRGNDMTTAKISTVACPKCGRLNGLHRTTCLFCGQPLLVPGQESQVLPSLRDAADIEPGYNVIFLPSLPPTAEAIEEVATVGRLTPEQAAHLLASPSPVPIARAATSHDAVLLTQRLAQSGLRTLILSDTQLSPLHPPRRARALVAVGEYLEVWSSEPATPPPALERHLPAGLWDAAFPSGAGAGIHGHTPYQGRTGGDLHQRRRSARH